jgi:CHAT domain-containing protein
VFVSSCWGGEGLPVSGEGVLSLQRAFATTGARSVIAALWAVDDGATRVLVDEFYKNLWGTDGRPRLGKLAALRKAQLTVAERFDPEHGQLRDFGIPAPVPVVASNGTRSRLSPRFWAAFVLAGNWR